MVEEEEEELEQAVGEEVATEAWHEKPRSLLRLLLSLRRTSLRGQRALGQRKISRNA